MAPTVKQCCCGCSLKSGTIIIGALSLVCSFIAVVYSIVSVSLGQAITPEMAKQLNITENMRESANVAVDAERYSTIVIMCLEIVLFSLSVLLLVGAKRENPLLLKPWIICEIIYLSLSAFLFVIMIILFFVFVGAGSGIAMLIYAAVVLPRMFGALSLGICIGELIVTGMLLYGIIAENPDFILPWVLYTITAIVYAMIPSNVLEYVGFSEFPSFELAFLLELAALCIIIVYFHYDDLKKSRGSSTYESI